MFGEYLYELTARDTKVTQLELFYAYINLSLTSVLTISTSIKVPLGRLLLVYSIQVRATGGAGQFVLKNEVYVIEQQSSAIIAIVDSNNPDAPQAILNTNIKGQPLIILDSTKELAMSAKFNNFVNANTVESSVHGVLIPRANFSI